MKNKYFKIILFALLLLLLFFIVLVSYSDDEKLLVDDLFNRVRKDDLVYNISFNSNQAVYDNECGCLYVSDLLFLNKVKVKAYSNYKTKQYIEKIGDDNYLVVYSKDYYQLIPIVITNIPIVNVFVLNIPHDYDFVGGLSYFKDEIIDEVSNVAVQAMYTSNKNIVFKSSEGSLSVRGSSSRSFDKKSYKLKFENKIDILGIRDDVFVLDALMIDRSKIRNMLSTSLWNDINNNQVINNDLSGEFVELFINNKYNGLYVLKNKVNKKVVSLQNDGILLKSIAYVDDNYIENLLKSNFSIDEDGIFLNYQIKKYSDLGYNEIVSKLKNYYSSYSYDSICESFDIDNYLNYIVFVSLIGGGDNLSYNRYLSLQNSNSKILITPWDMDLTWGLIWSDDDEVHGSFFMESSFDDFWMTDNITRNMDEKTFKSVKKRYWELRKKVITMDTIDSYLNLYKKTLVESDSFLRDGERWVEYDIEYEINQIHNWAYNRILFLDNFFE